MNDCKSLADALLAAGSAASKTSEDERLRIELSMIKQGLSRNETLIQWVEGATKPADVLTKGKERGHFELLRKLLDSARYQVRGNPEMLDGNASYCDTKNVNEQASDDIEEHL